MAEPREVEVAVKCRAVFAARFASFAWCPWCAWCAWFVVACGAGGGSVTASDANPFPARSHTVAQAAAPVDERVSEDEATGDVAPLEGTVERAEGIGGVMPKDIGDESCPGDMVLVSGNYCPDVRHKCLEWTDPPGPYENFRCAKYASPATCASDRRVPLRFCIDRLEYTPPGAALPAVHHSWTTAKQTCESIGRRMCRESEWQFACEGEAMHPYPYGGGFTRDATACNIDRRDLGRPNTGLRDLRTAAGSHPRCASPFGVLDMSGNVEEWATLDHPADAHDRSRDRSTMKGAWWLPGRNTCRAATTGHGERYEGAQVGVRCCRDAK